LIKNEKSGYQKIVDKNSDIWVKVVNIRGAYIAVDEVKCENKKFWRRFLVQPEKTRYHWWSSGKAELFST